MNYNEIMKHIQHVKRLMLTTDDLKIRFNLSVCLLHLRQSLEDTLIENDYLYSEVA
jgi:hypothetical protein